MTQYQETRPQEAPFDEPVEEPPENPNPYSEPHPAETPGRPLDPARFVPPPESRASEGAEPRQAAPRE